MRFVSLGLFVFFLVGHVQDVFAKKSKHRYPKSFVMGNRAKTLGLKAYEVQLEVDHFNSTSHSDENGNDVSFKDSESFQRVQAQLKLTYGYGKFFDVFIGARYRQNSSVNTNPNTQETVSADSSGLESGLLGGRYFVARKGKWNFTIEAWLRMVAYSNKSVTSDTSGTSSENTDSTETSIDLGDGANSVAGGGVLSYKSSRSSYFFGELFYHLPRTDLSQELLYDIHYLKLYKTFAYVLGVKGVHSLETSPHSSDPTTRSPQARGATFLYNSVNRSWATPYVGFNFAFKKKWRFDFRVGNRLQGKSTDLGWETLARLVWFQQGVTKKELKEAKFKNYLFEATVIKVSPRGRFIKIDKGLAHDVNVGMKIDFFKTDFFGGNILIGSGTVHQASATYSIVKLRQLYREDIKIATGFTARGHQ